MLLHIWGVYLWTCTPVHRRTILLLFLVIELVLVVSSAPHSGPLARGGSVANIARMSQPTDTHFSQLLASTLPRSLRRLEARSRLAACIARSATSGADVALRFGERAQQRLSELSGSQCDLGQAVRVTAPSLYIGGYR